MLHFSIYCKQQKLDRSYPPSFSPFLFSISEAQNEKSGLRDQHYNELATPLALEACSFYMQKSCGNETIVVQCVIFSEILLHVTLSQGITWTSVSRTRPCRHRLRSLRLQWIEGAWLISVRETSQSHVHV